MKSIKSLPILFLCATIFPLTGCHEKENEPKNDLKPVKVFDWNHDETRPIHTLEFEIEELDNPKFTLYADSIKQVDTNFTVNDVDALYLYDANQDGYRDLCVSGSVDTIPYADYCAIYDVKNNERIFYIIDSVVNAYNDYHFSLVNNKLVLTKDRCGKSAIVDQTYADGRIEYSKDKGVFVKWNNRYLFDKCDFSFNIANEDNEEIELKEDKGVYTANLNTNTLYSITVDYKSASFDVLNYQEVNEIRPHVVSLSNRSNYDDSLTIYKIEDTEGCYKMYFYFIKGNTSNYELHASGHSKLLKFDIKHESGHTLSDLIAVNRNNILKATQEENDLVGTYDYLCRVTDVTYDENNKALLDVPVSEINSAIVNKEKELSHRFTYETKGATKKVIELFDERIMKYNDKYYVLLGTFDFDSIKHEGHDGTFNFSLKEKTAEAENLNDGQKILVNNIDSLVVIRTYANVDLTFSYKIKIGMRTFYISDATHFCDSSRSGFKYYYVIKSENNFSSLFQ